MGWMGLSLRVRILSVIAILLALALVAIASVENARGDLQPGHGAFLASTPLDSAS